MKPARAKKCKSCGQRFMPLRPMQIACSIACSVSYARGQREKAERRQDRQRRENLKTRSDYMKEAQAAFNAYIRERDAHLPCICCGLPLVAGVGDAVGGDFDCGHYRSVGSAPHLRFHERNAHGQRKKCNRWGAGRAVDYRLGLIERIGLAAVEDLEADQTPRNWTVPDLIHIRDIYRAKKRALLAARKLQEAA